MKIQYIDRQTGELKAETPPAEILLRFLYHNPFGKSAILPIAKRTFISNFYGKKMDRRSSVKKIKPFINQLNIDMSESLKNVDEFTSFNDFFCRKLKAGARQIQDGIVSPGDGKIIAFEDVKGVNTFFVKGTEFTLSAFLKDEDLAKSFSNSSLVILRLAPNDYHRFHFPISGTPSSVKPINGYYCSVSPYALSNSFTKVFCENKREYCILDTKDKGKMLIAPVGATMVGSIKETYTPNTQVAKGDEMGYFEFGGSTIVMLMDRDKIKIDEDILQNTQNKLETFVRMGEHIAK